MKRRTFIKFLAGLPLIGSLPVLGKPKTMVFDGCDSYLKADAFALNEPQTIYHLHKPVKLKNVMYFNKPLTEKEKGEVLDYMVGEVRIFDGAKSRLVLDPNPMPIGLKGVRE